MSLPGSYDKIASLLIACSNGARMRAFCLHVRETVKNPEAIEILIKIDEGRDDLAAEIENLRTDISPLTLKFTMTSARLGYYSLHIAYDDLRALASKSYYLAILSDRARFTRSGWDAELGQYVGLYPHNCFCVRTSKHKEFEYASVSDAWHYCENWGFYTQEYISAIGGYGDFWCPDAWLQITDYVLHQLTPCREQTAVISRTFSCVRDEHDSDDEIYKAFRGLYSEIFFAKRMLSLSGMRNFLCIAQELSSHMSPVHSQHVRRPLTILEYVKFIWPDLWRKRKYFSAIALFSIIKNRKLRALISNALARRTQVKLILSSDLLHEAFDGKFDSLDAPVEVDIPQIASPPHSTNAWSE